MKILITGASGYLGSALVASVEGHHTLRLLDVVAPEHSPHEVVVGSVADLETVTRAVDGVDAMIISHMAPRRPGVYDSPTLPFDINVRGTANLYAAAAAAGVKRVALISSIAVVDGHRGQYLRCDLPASTRDIYGLTKACQETIARHYHQACGISTAILRPSYIQDADTMADKYGRVANEVNWHYIDRRDIGKACRLALEHSDIGCKVFYLLGHPKAVDHAEMKPAYEKLGWKPDHDFTHKPYAGSSKR
jgi:nucleoside-diphosphate-sugar epimerase